MDDVFYASQRKVSLQEIERAVRGLGYTSVQRSDSGLAIAGKDTARMLWHVAPHALEDVGPTDRQRLVDEQVASMFCISHHPRDREDLLVLLRELLRRFGGWVGNDDDGFEPRFGAETIDGFRYPDE